MQFCSNKRSWIIKRFYDCDTTMDVWENALLINEIIRTLIIMRARFLLIWNSTGKYRSGRYDTKYTFSHSKGCLWIYFWEHYTRIDFRYIYFLRLIPYVLSRFAKLLALILDSLPAWRGRFSVDWLTLRLFTAFRDWD